MFPFALTTHDNLSVNRVRIRKNRWPLRVFRGCVLFVFYIWTEMFSIFGLCETDEDSVLFRMIFRVQRFLPNFWHRCVVLCIRHSMPFEELCVNRLHTDDAYWWIIFDLWTTKLSTNLSIQLFFQSKNVTVDKWYCNSAWELCLSNFTRERVRNF